MVELKELEQYKDYDIVPIKDEIYSDFTTPLNVLRNIKENHNKFYLLESVEQNRSGRYSYLGYNPIHRLSCKDNIVRFDGNEFHSEKPIEEVSKILNSLIIYLCFDTLFRLCEYHVFL